MTEADAQVDRDLLLDHLEDEIRERRDDARAMEERLDGWREGKEHGKATAYNNVLDLLDELREGEDDG